ncbi:MAG: hypothetical protein IJ653_05970 [Bacteroidales bacterium]|nr:hypothetical protein [Bacteroidales bacterium]
MSIVHHLPGFQVHDGESPAVISDIEPSVTVFRAASHVLIQPRAVCRSVIPDSQRGRIDMLDSVSVSNDPYSPVLGRKSCVQIVAQEPVFLRKERECESIAIQDADSFIETEAPERIRRPVEIQADDLVIQDFRIAGIPVIEIISGNPAQPILRRHPYHPLVVDGQVQGEAVCKSFPDSEMPYNRLCPQLQAEREGGT